MGKYTLGIVAAVSNEKILKENLRQSPLIKNDCTPLLEIRGAKSASEAYNQDLRYFCTADLIIYAHQDVYIPESWYDNLAKALDQLEQQQKKWAVLGVFGKTKQGKAVGRLWDSGLGIELGMKYFTPTRVDALDELLIIINPKAGLNFDEKLTGFHLFGADICASARSLGYQCYAIHAPVIHNSKRIQSLGGDYSRAYRYLQKKWRRELPLNAICSNITPWGIEYMRIRFSLAYRRYLGLLPNRIAGLDNAKSIAKKLGYE
jgi:hypothetical protein